MAASVGRHLGLGLAALLLAVTGMAYAPVAEAQFFRFFEQAPRQQQKPRTYRPRTPPPGDDLPPIVPRESLAPPPPDDRPYDNKLMRLAEILGAVHYLRELCGAEDGQLWRNQMRAILQNEGTTAVRRAKLVNSFNDGYRGYRRTHRTCTPSAIVASKRFSTEGATIAASLAQTSVFSNPAPKAAENASADVQAQAAEPTGPTDPAGAAPEANAARPAEPEPPD
ncbi:MAG: TIGR02301 family protein [Methyloceanibacter sp.]